MLRTTVGQLMINEALPEDMRDYDRVLDKGGIKNLLTELAEKHPDKYRVAAKKLSDIGHASATSTGGYSFGLSALRQSLSAKKMRLDLNRELQKLYAADMPDDAKEEKILATVEKYRNKLIDDVMQESLAEDNPLARQALSGSRGNKVNVNSLRGADLLYTDHRGRPLPLPVMRSYSMGLKPYEYFAGAFGARKGVIDVKSATQDAGYFAKQLVQAAHRLLVSQMDDENPYDPSTPRGLPVDTDDPDNEGSMLAHPIGGYERNTLLTPRILKELKADGHDQILVRSPTVGGPEDGGVYAYDAGRREKSELSPVGDYVGIAAAQSLAEPISQLQLSSKHSGGIAGQGPQQSGFAFLNSLVQVPKTFPGGAAHAQLDGRVQSIEKAPQGGHYVKIDGKKHYINSLFDVTVKPGDEVAAGDVLSNGIPNPAEIVRHKGVGEGRRYFTKTFREALKASGTYGNRRNIELLARGLINHVRLTDEIGDWVPDDVVPYQVLERQWKPRAGHVVIPPTQAKGYYLERPVLHYSVGTRLQPAMIEQLKTHGVPSVYAHADPPPFQPEMIRGMASVSHDPDWQARLLGSYQQKSLLQGTHRGAVSDEAGTSYVPSLVRGEDFGQSGLTQGWKSSDKNKTPP